MPLAPASIVVSMARFIVRRKLERFCSCSAMSSATSWGSTSGRLTSMVLISMRRWVRSSNSLVSLSTSWPFLPMIMPTRAEWMNTVTFSRVRSMRMRWSSTSSSAKSCLLAYQWLSQSVMMPVRKPVGRTF